MTDKSACYGLGLVVQYEKIDWSPSAMLSLALTLNPRGRQNRHGMDKRQLRKLRRRLGRNIRALHRESLVLTSRIRNATMQLGILNNAFNPPPELEARLQEELRLALIAQDGVQKRLRGF